MPCVHADSTASVLVLGRQRGVVLATVVCARSMVRACKGPPAPGRMLLLNLALLVAFSSLGLDTVKAQRAPAAPHVDEVLEHLALSNEGGSTLSTRHATKPQPQGLPRLSHPERWQPPMGEPSWRLTTGGGSLTAGCPAQRVNVTNNTDLAAATIADVT